MTERVHIQVREKEGNVYASHEDFHTIFNEDLKPRSEGAARLASHGTLRESTFHAGKEVK
jgi:hypothetical protein